MSDDDTALEKKAGNLIDHCGPLADQARPDPVQRLQIQLFVGFGWNKACRRPLYRLVCGEGLSVKNWQRGSSKMKLAAFLMGAALSSPISALGKPTSAF